MDRPVVIIGAGGHGRVVLDAARAAGHVVRGFIDASHPAGTLINDAPVLGDDGSLTDALLADCAMVVALGHQARRRAVAEGLAARGARFATVCHPAAVLSPYASLGPGTMALAGVVVNANARIGAHCILNTGCRIEHDVQIGDFGQISPGAILAGAVTCGPDVMVGAGAVVIPGLALEAGCLVAAGATVVRPVAAGQRVAGVPARPMDPPR